MISDDLKIRAEAAAAAAAGSADSVDLEARFPAEAFQAARAQRLLGILAAPGCGGEGARISDVVDICYILGKSCASTAMIFTMHQIMVAILVRHTSDSGWHGALLRRLCAHQLLLASSTTDGQGGGDLRASACTVAQTASGIALEKKAAVMSYGAHADGLLTTARRSPDAQPSDQVLVAFLKEDYRLEQVSGWNALGMRGTCSAGFVLRGKGSADQVLPVPYSHIHAQTMMPVAHLTWSGVWCGLAAGAVLRARRFVRTASRRSGGQLPPGAAHLTRADLSLRTLRAAIAVALRTYEAAAAAEGGLESLEVQTALNLHKVNASELAIATVMSAMQACGISGYRNDGEFSVSRHLRDALSSSVMINNDRILASTASSAMLVDVPRALAE